MNGPGRLRIWWDDRNDLWAISLVDCGGDGEADVMYLDAYWYWDQAVAAANAMIQSYEREGAW